MTSLIDCVYESHTESGPTSGIGFDMESQERAIIDETIDGLKAPRVSELYFPLEDSRCDESETADDLLKRAVEIWIGDKCKVALLAHPDYITSCQRAESLTVCVTLLKEWKDWIVSCN